MTGARRTLVVDGPLDLRSVLRSVSFGWARWTAEGWVRPMRTPDGPATLRVSRDGSGVHGEAWGPGSDWVLDRLGDWVGAGDDPSAFVTDHPVVARLAAANAGLRLARTRLVFEAAMVAVLGQKVTGKEMKMGLRGMTRRFSELAPGPVDSLRLPPDPARIAAEPYHAFHDLQMEKRRTDTLRRLAKDAGRLDRLAVADTHDAARYLRRYPGVGPWTVAETLVFSHADADAVSVGDFHLKHHVVFHLTGRPRGTDEEMLELLEPFRPHRGRVARLLESAGPYPRYGPRLPVRSFADY